MDSFLPLKSRFKAIKSMYEKVALPKFVKKYAKMNTLNVLKIKLKQSLLNLRKIQK